MVKNEIENTEANEYRIDLPLLEEFFDIFYDKIITTKCMQRASQKYMGIEFSNDELEQHISDREEHMKQATAIAKKLAKGLELNEKLAQLGMILHDIGHTFSGHEGEVIVDSIARAFNVGFFHHNAEGVNVADKEEIEKTIEDKIRGKLINDGRIDELRNLHSEVKKTMAYILDIVISHDGETTPEDESKLQEQRELIKGTTIEEIVKEKVILSTTKDQYKFLAETPEGILAKRADIIAYLKSDMLDAKRTGYIEQFSPEYLQQLGKLICNNGNDIKMKSYIEGIKLGRLAEKWKENRDIAKQVYGIVKKIKDKGIDTYDITDRRLCKMEEYNIAIGIIKDSLKEIQEKMRNEFNDDKTINAYIKTIKQQLKGMLTIDRDMMDRVMTIAQEKLVLDFVENSKGKNPEEMNFSKPVYDIVMELRRLDYMEFSKTTNTEFQDTIYPSIHSNLVEKSADYLIEIGFVKEMFSNEFVKKKISKQQAEILECVNNNECQESDKSKSYTKPQLDFLKGRFVKSLSTKYQNESDEGINRTAQLCINVYNASKYTNAKHIANTINAKFEAKTKIEKQKIIERKKKLNEIFQEKIIKTGRIKKSELMQILDKLSQEGNIENILVENKDMDTIVQDMKLNENDKIKYEAIIDILKNYYQELLELDKKDLEHRVAIKLANDYIAGMPDGPVRNLYEKFGLMHSPMDDSMDAPVK